MSLQIGVTLGFLEDAESLKSKWSTFSLLSKILLLTLLMTSFLSITSLADHIFKLKGFIVEGLNFWLAITSYIVDLLSFIDISIQSWQLDFLIVFGIAFLPYVSERWKILPNSNRLRIIALLSFYIVFPFTVSESTATYTAIYLYIATLAVCLLPPRTDSFGFIALRMVTPPILVVIVAAISEGIYRPMI
jgi:predicted small integral membrane protein